ncbi:SLC45 family MFS transporter [Caldibacillus lycopersici]|uniref:SLC45 family MFS transporter n=1 Tax=Perspicuibacillus lycopersici TaxID=1325689 RepID=A0AAE3IRZ1_9BACI|nr:SLC45 family MFS transporter [Perspicuibacillus lycopersici]MCU9612543.1 SLC45 family MFS transporter [Perspicuibacillus lycopersici]
MKKTFLLGFGFLSISIAWALYNAFVPLFLEDLLSNLALIGFLMTIDNYIALFLQPYIGHKSDKTNTRFGKRMPYLIIGMPLAALFLALVPFYVSLPTLLFFMVAMNLSMAIFRSPTIALMPDITPEQNRTKANGIINFMGGIGAIIAFAIGSKLYELGQPIPFLAASGIILLSLFILLRNINEKRDTIEYTKHMKQKINYKEEFNRPTIFLLLAIFFWFVAYQGMESLFTIYATNELGMSDGAATFSLTFFSLTFVLFALPSGWLGAKFGKKKIIMIGVIGLGTIFLSLTFIHSVLLLRILLLIGGMFWACININSYPFIVSTGSEHSIGSRTGLYYLVSSLAAITGPPVFGQIIELTDYSILFAASTISMVFALISLSFVKHSGNLEVSTKNLNA